jgi:hypothetical protein
LGDVKGARSLLAEARTIIDSISDAGDLPRRLEEAERKLKHSARSLDYGQSLTEREMGILRLFASQLSNS